jgi:hypothetical protein
MSGCELIVVVTILFMYLILLLITALATKERGLLRDFEAEVLEETMRQNPNLGNQALFDLTNEKYRNLGLPEVPSTTMKGWVQSIREKTGLAQVRPRTPKEQVRFMQSILHSDLRISNKSLHEKLVQKFGLNAISQKQVQTWLKMNRPRAFKDSWTGLTQELEQVDLTDFTADAPSEEPIRTDPKDDQKVGSLKFKLDNGNKLVPVSAKKNGLASWYRYGKKRDIRGVAISRTVEAMKDSWTPSVILDSVNSKLKADNVDSLTMDQIHVIMQNIRKDYGQLPYPRDQIEFIKDQLRADRTVGGTKIAEQLSKEFGKEVALSLKQTGVLVSRFKSLEKKRTLT